CTPGFSALIVTGRLSMDQGDISHGADCCLRTLAFALTSVNKLSGFGGLSSPLSRTLFSSWGCGRGTYQRIARGRRHEQAACGEHLATTEAAPVGQHRAVLAQQQPVVGGEAAVKPHRV